ncbi:MAG: PPOX class F420-dependent oxidoreductase [Thermoleophilia bacterium]
MPRTPVPPQVDAFLARPNPAIMATVRPDGSPHTVATWYDWQDGRVLLSFDDGRRRLDHIRRDPRISLTVLDPDSWYRHISLLGAVEETAPDPDLSGIDRLAVRYTGAPYGNRDDPRTIAWVRIDRWHGWDTSHAVIPASEWP